MLALIVAACSDSTGPAFQITADDQNQAAVMSAASATAEDVNVLTASDMTMSGGATADMIRGGSLFSRSAQSVAASYSWSFAGACTYEQSTTRFTCPPITDAGLTLARDYAFFDANGASMSAYDPAATASANFHVTVTGVHTAVAGADTVNRERSMTVSNLAGAETWRLWNGSGTRDDGGFRSDATATRTYHTTDHVTITDVKVTLPRSSNPWPASGTITRVISGTGTVEKSGVTKSFSIARTVTVTFNGTQYATMSVGGNTYTLDLATGIATRN